MEIHDLLHAPMPRRTVLLGTGLAAFLAACGSSTTAADPATTTTNATSAPPATELPSATVVATSATPATPTTVVEAVPTTDTGAISKLTAADFAGSGTCVLSPEKTAGPFPLDEQFDRSDITEGLPGHPLRLGLRVVDAACVPVPNATVEIWHTDSTGDYSAYIDGGGGKDDGPGTTFCRGTQAVNADGIAEFLTLYPGWYSGRAVHIHLRVHVDGHIALTSQLFFDDDYTATVYSGPAYVANGLPDMLTADDGIAGDAAGEGTIMQPAAAETARGTGSIALHNLAIDPAAVSAGGAGGPGGPPPGGGTGGPPPGGPRPGDTTTTAA